MIFPPLLSGWLLLVTSIIQQNWRKIRCLANRESLDFQAFPVFRNRHKTYKNGGNKMFEGKMLIIPGITMKITHIGERFLPEKFDI
jgi:hypothetical protein